MSDPFVLVDVLRDRLLRLGDAAIARGMANSVVMLVMCEALGCVVAICDDGKKDLEATIKNACRVIEKVARATAKELVVSP